MSQTQSSNGWYNDYNQKALDRIESILGMLNIEYQCASDTLIDITCPIHGSDSLGNSKIRLTDGTWRCFSGNCCSTYGKTIMGLIRGTFVATGQPSDWRDVQDFIDGGHTVCPIARIIKEAPDLFKDESTLPKMEIPSKYYLTRGFSEESLKYFGVGDAYKFPYKHKAIIPIRYLNGEYMGFSARSHWPNCPKCEYHHNKYETCISKKDDFHFMFKRWKHSKNLQKGKTLYGIEKIKSLNTDKIALLEGPSCVWKLYDYNIPAVACLGKDFSKDRYELLVNCGIKKILFIPDNDEAGLEFKNRFVTSYHDKFDIYLPHINKKDVSEMTDSDIKQYIVSRWDKI